MSAHAVRAEALAATALGLFSASVVGLAHLGQQAVDDWPWLVLILTGFGTQVGLDLDVAATARLRFTTPVPAGAAVESRITGQPADAIATWTAP
ncbi:hypothetical protein [Saccharothrix variisporea]|nr:hypothetical protein [Saccharothrix variisporea]